MTLVVGIPACACPDGTDVPLRECPQSLPSVTAILDAFPKPYLAAWGKKVVAEAAVDNLPNLAAMLAQEGRTSTLSYLKRLPDILRDEAAERGSAVHKAAELDSELDDVPAEALPRYEQYREWLGQQEIEVVAKERTVWDYTFGYAGSYDLAAIRNGFRWLIDIKTSSYDVRRYGLGSWRLQLAAYRFAGLESEHVTAIDGRGPRYYHPTPGLEFRPVEEYDAAGVLQLTDTDFYLWNADVGTAEFDTFTAVREVWAWLRSGGKATLAA